MSSGCGQEASGLTVSVDCDPPVRHATVAAFTARALAVQLDRLFAVRAAGFARLTLTATNADGVVLCREWRHDNGFDADEVTELARAQLVAWLSDEAATGLFAVSLVPGDIRPWFTLEREPRGLHDRFHSALQSSPLGGEHDEVGLQRLVRSR